jgi:RHH-type rel operon transcriptional repressor/antitoxin RelB
VIDTETLTIRVPKSVLDELRSQAERTGRDVDELAGEALAAYLDLQEWQIAAIDEAIAEADSGAPLYAHEDVMRWLESWETRNELPPPQ